MSLNTSHDGAVSSGIEANGTVVKGDVSCEGRLVIYIIKADRTSYINYIKPLILARELSCPHVVSVISTKDEAYRAVHPERYVPALRDRCPDTGRDAVAFESTACLQYIAERYDPAGAWAGRNAWERAQVLSWTSYQTAGLGETAKYWLYFSKGYPSREAPEPPPKTIAKLRQNVLKQWETLERRLSQPGQDYIAVPDRPTIADLSFLPFAMPYMFNLLEADIDNYKSIQRWCGVMTEREAVQYVLKKGPTYGHFEDE